MEGWKLLIAIVITGWVCGIVATGIPTWYNWLGKKQGGLYATIALVVLIVVAIGLGVLLLSLSAIAAIVYSASLLMRTTFGMPIMILVAVCFLLGMATTRRFRKKNLAK